MEAVVCRESILPTIVFVLPILHFEATVNIGYIEFDLKRQFFSPCVNLALAFSYYPVPSSEKAPRQGLINDTH